VAPLAASTAWLADPLVRLLYGSRWLDVVPLLPWAVTGIALAAIAQTGYTLLLAHQQQSGCLAADVWRLVGTTAALAGLAGIGLPAYLAGMAGVHAVSLTLILWLLRTGDAVSVRGLAEAIVPAVISLVPAWRQRPLGTLVNPSGSMALREPSTVLAMACRMLRLGFRRRFVSRRPVAGPAAAQPSAAPRTDGVGRLLSAHHRVRRPRASGAAPSLRGNRAGRLARRRLVAQVTVALVAHRSRARSHAFAAGRSQGVRTLRNAVGRAGVPGVAAAVIHSLAGWRTENAAAAGFPR
jgi:hypothetical protein